MYLLAAVAGLTAGFIVWLVASHWVAASIAWAEDRRPELIGSRRLRVREAIACGLLFAICLAVAFWIMRLIWIQIR